MALELWRDIDRWDTVPYWRRRWFDDSDFWPSLVGIDRKWTDLEWKWHNEWRYLRPKVTKDGYEVTIDTHPFKPYEVTVRTHNNQVSIEGKHHEYRNGSTEITRQFHRRYTLPLGCDPDRVTSEISSDGYLTVKAPKQRVLCDSKRVVPIKHTYRRAILD